MKERIYHESLAITRRHCAEDFSPVRTRPCVTADVPSGDPSWNVHLVRLCHNSCDHYAVIILCVNRHASGADCSAHDGTACGARQSCYILYTESEAQLSVCHSGRNYGRTRAFIDHGIDNRFGIYDCLGDTRILSRRDHARRRFDCRYETV